MDQIRSGLHLGSRPFRPWRSSLPISSSSAVGLDKYLVYSHLLVERLLSVVHLHAVARLLLLHKISRVGELSRDDNCLLDQGITFITLQGIERNTW
jgi:hypothetical protein